QKGSNGERGVAQVERSRADLEQQRRHDQEVVPTDQDDLDVRAAPEQPFQMAGRVDAAEAAAQYDDARRSPLRFSDHRDFSFRLMRPWPHDRRPPTPCPDEPSRPGSISISIASCFAGLTG